MKITSSVKIYILLILLGGSLIFAAAAFSLYKASDIQSIWLDFNESRSDKNRAFRALREQMGYGGMIHHFKNYLLRRDPDTKAQVHLRLGGAKATLKRYKSLVVNKDELNAINIIENTLLAYEKAINKIDNKIAAGESTKAIDKTVKIDDTQAFEAMKLLEEVIYSDQQINGSTKISKSHLITNIRQELGYGGMIHFYKNYILRNNKELKDRVELNLKSSLFFIEQYYQHEMNKKEIEAVNMLQEYLTKYKNKLSIIEGMISMNSSPVKIDQNVKINDLPILTALNTLEQQSIIQLEHRATKLENSIEFVVLSTKVIGGMVLVIILLMALGSFWFVNLKIVHPVTALIKVMARLSKGEFNIDIKGVDNKNEIGDMARSVDIFKEAVRARVKFEEQLTDVNAKLEERVVERTQELENNQKRLNAIVDTAVDAIIVIDDRGIINSFNASAVSMFGYNASDIMGQSFNILIPQQEKTDYNQYLKNYKKRNKGAETVGKGREIIALHKGGKEFPVEIAISETFIENTKMFTGIIRDVSERYFHEEQIRRTQKMNALGKLTGGIAHDYNNMLAVIIGYAGILGNALVHDKRLHGFANEIIKAGERGSKLTSKLLDFSRHKPTNEKQVVNVNQLMDDMESMLSSTLTARINLDYKFDSVLWDVNIDVADFENVFLNMCINAMHAIDDMGSITVSTENFLIDAHTSSTLNVIPGDYIKISIVDTGCGMGSDIQEHIFDPFYSTKEDKGTGLGLSQVYGFMQRCNGAIKVYSEIGKGTNFSLFLPRDKSNDSQGKNTHLTLSDTENLQGSESILVVDDEPALVMLADEMLKSFGYNVYCATSGIEALKILDEQRDICFVLSDIVMPAMDGYELASKIKKKYPNIIIQFASGYTAVDDSQKGGCEYLDVISKPYSSLKLARKIRILLDSHK